LVEIGYISYERYLIIRWAPFLTAEGESLWSRMMKEATSWPSSKRANQLMKEKKLRR
jgi:hypothetical protein